MAPGKRFRPSNYERPEKAPPTRRGNPAPRRFFALQKLCRGTGRTPTIYFWFVLGATSFASGRKRQCANLRSLFPLRCRGGVSLGPPTLPRGTQTCAFRNKPAPSKQMCRILLTFLGSPTSSDFLRPCPMWRILFTILGLRPAHPV